NPTPTPGPGPSPPAGCDPGSGPLFPQTGHRVCAPFFAWWTRYGGLAQFGYPITEALAERDPASGITYTVQYFERARFEYHPEYEGTPAEVLLGLLGVQVARQARLLP